MKSNVLFNLIHSYLAIENSNIKELILLKKSVRIAKGLLIKLLIKKIVQKIKTFLNPDKRKHSLYQPRLDN